MNRNIAARAYTQVGLETGISDADPHRLILMLYDGALLALRKAEGHLRARRIGAKGECVSKAIQIIEEGLRLSLDKTVGGPIAGQLDDIYEYMSRRLLLSSAANDPAGFQEVAHLLSGLREAWAAIAVGKGTTVNSSAVNPDAAGRSMAIPGTGGPVPAVSARPLRASLSHPVPSR